MPDHRWQPCQPIVLGYSHSFPGRLPSPTRDKGDETSAGHGHHSKIAVTGEKLVGLDRSQLIRGWQFSELTTTWCWRHGWGRRLARTRDSRPYGCPECLAMGDHGTARGAGPAAVVHTFTHWAAPDAHGCVRSVRLRTSFPTRRPGRGGSVPGGRGTAVRNPLPRRADAGRG